MVNRLNNSCVVCKHNISDPRCVKCYIKEIELKLNDIGVHSFAIDVVVPKLRKRVFIDTLNEEVCILCGKENISICRFCFSIILDGVLIELNFPEEFINDLGYNKFP